MHMASWQTELMNTIYGLEHMYSHSSNEQAYCDHGLSNMYELIDKLKMVPV